MLTASGIVTVDGIIEFPEEWKGNIEVESIIVQVTAIGSAQELYVDRIEWGTRAVIRNGGGGALKAYYTVTANSLTPEPAPAKINTSKATTTNAPSKARRNSKSD